MTHDSSGAFSELRILLLGPKNAGKSSAGNTILGKNVFDLKLTLQSEHKRGKVFGYKLTLVDTPGWWPSLPFEENPELYKQEVILSFTQCKPGPHALLLVLNVDTPFQHQEKDVLYENMRCFGEEVWRHTIVLFTRVNRPADTGWFKENEGETLHWLLKKCDNRHHFLNIKNTSDGSQVTELLEKIQKMVEGNQGRHYEIDRKILQCLGEKRRALEIRAEERKKIFKKTPGNKDHLAEVRIVLLGCNGAGKSSTGNTILGKAAFDLKRSMTSVTSEGKVSGRHITVVDTPGKRRDYCSKYTPRLYKDEIVLSSSHCPPEPHVFLLVIRVDIAFPEVYRRAVEEQVSSLGLDVWDHMIVVFTFGDWLVETSIEQFIEGEGEALQWIIEKCGNRYHVFNNQDKEDVNQVIELFEKIEEMVTKNKGKRYKIDKEKLNNVKKRRMEAEKTAKQIKDKVKKRNVRHLMSGYAECHEMELVLFGPYCSDKTSTRNTILGEEVFDKTSGQNQKECGEVSGRKLTVVYIPGFENGYNLEKTLEDAKLNILRSVKKCSSGTHAFILTLCVDCSFSEEEKSSVKKIIELLGERVWNHTLVLFTVMEHLENDLMELFIASEGDALQWLIEKCGNRYHVLNIKNRGDGSQVTKLLEKIEEMVAKNRGAYEMDKETLEEMERQVTVSIRRAQKSTRALRSFSSFAKSTNKPIDKDSSLSSGIGSERMSTRSKDFPIDFRSGMSLKPNIAKKSSLSSGIGSERMSTRSKDFPIDFRSSMSLKSKLSSGLESESEAFED